MSKSKIDCFIIMPIADTDGYKDGHFGHVYENIIKPSCDMAGYKPTRADEVKETNLIHLDILKKLIEAPLAICDLSSRNPNVLFELGIRQAFDKPVVLIQEKGTKKIFDIAPLRYLEYDKEMSYHDVLSIQEELKLALTATAKAENDSTNINSIVKLLALNSAASIPDIENGNDSLALNILRAEIRDLKKMFENSMYEKQNFIHSDHESTSFITPEIMNLIHQLENLENDNSNGKISTKTSQRRSRVLLRESERLMEKTFNKNDHELLIKLVDRIHRFV